jgi:hypothetical protein
MSFYNRKVLMHENQGVLSEIIEQFFSAKPKKTVWGNFRIEGNELIYRAQNQEEFWLHNGVAHESNRQDLADVLKGKLKLVSGSNDLETIKARVKEKEHCKIQYVTHSINKIAIKLPNGQVLGNSSILPLIGRTVSYGNESLNRSETLIQRKLTQRAIMIPFTVFDQAKLDIEKFKMIEKGPEELVKRKARNPRYHSWEKQKGVPEFIDETVHFTGASLFEVDGEQFLFDVDRRELEHKIFNPFLVKMPKKAKTISEAYELLKPKEVLDAERKGLKVLRQGEWFFIPSKAPKLKRVTLTQDEIQKLLTDRFSVMDNKGLQAKAAMLPRPTTLQAGDNRPNNVQMGITQGKVSFVKGKVSHSGREHADLTLNDWHIAIPNTATKSFTITGDID